MKNSIPSDVWERKKALIATLYKDEEWPLKQVIKKIRSDDFNPSETQLRSRLKKWRVTKPSRQTRKKSHEDAAGDDSGREDGSPNGHSKYSPKTQARPQTRPLPQHHPEPTRTRLPVAEPEWYMTNAAYEQTGLPSTVSLDGSTVTNAWAPVSTHQSSLSPTSRSRDNSHGSLIVPTSTSYDQSNGSPLVDGMLLNPTPVMTPTFPDPPYSMGSESCMSTPVSTASTAAPIQWSIPQWYSMSMDGTSRSQSIPYYTTAPLSPPIDPMMHLMPPHGPQQMSDFQEGAKSWKRTMSVPYGPEGSHIHPRMSQKGRVPKLLERKSSLPSKITANQHPVGVVTPTSPYFPSGQHSVMCSPGYPYSGPDPLMNRPSSIEF